MKNKNEKGFTLLEMVLSLAILSVVMSIVFSLDFMGARTYDRGKFQSDLQQDTLKAAGFISQAVHAAEEVTILSSAADIPETVSEGNEYSYIYMHSSGSGLKTIVFMTPAGQMSALVDRYGEENSFGMTFTQTGSSGNVGLAFSLQGENHRQKYSLQSEAKLENGNYTDDTASSGVALRLKLSGSINDIPYTIFPYAVDDVVEINAADQTVSAANNSWDIMLLNDTFQDGVSASNIHLSNLPAGLSTAFSLVTDTEGNQMLRITLSGEASTAIELPSEVQLVIDKTAVNSGQEVMPLTLRLEAAQSTSISITAVDDKVHIMDPLNQYADATDETWQISLSGGTLRNSIESISDGDYSDYFSLDLPSGLIITQADILPGDLLELTVGGVSVQPVYETTTVQFTLLGSAFTAGNSTDSNLVELQLIPNQAVTENQYVVINQDIFVYGTTVSTSGSTSVTGEDSTIAILESEDNTTVFGGNVEIQVKSVFIDNDTYFTSSTKLGKIVNGEFTTETVYITKDLYLNNGGAEINAQDVFIDGNVSYSKSAKINAENLHIKGDVLINNGGSAININARNVFIDGSVSGNGININAEFLYIKGDLTLNGGGDQINAQKIYVDGNVTITSSGKIYAESIYIKVDLHFENWGALLSATYYYAGGSIYILQPGNITGTRIYEWEPLSAEPPTAPAFPELTIDTMLKDPEWYWNNGYVDGGDLSDGVKIYTESDYSFSNWQSFNNVIIVSKGDINLTNNMTLSGVLLAPFGKVTFGGAHFEGLVIARDGFDVTNGSCQVVFKDISIYISDAADYPFQ